MKKTLFFTFFVVLFFPSFIEKENISVQPKTRNFSGEFLFKWIDLHLEMIKYVQGYTPPVASRTIGYNYLALYESVVPGMPEYKSLNYHFKYSRNMPIPDLTVEYYWPASATSSLAHMLRRLFPLAPEKYVNQIDSLEKSDSLHFINSISEEVLARSFQFGRDIAETIFTYGATDGGEYAYTRNFPSTYTAPAAPGLWVPTPSSMQPVFNYRSAMQPYWGNNRPFLEINIMNDLMQLPPPVYSVDTTSILYGEAKAVCDQVKYGTSDEKKIAIYWADDVGTYSPGGHSLAIAKIILDNKNADLALSAEVLAKIGMAVSDAFINCFKNKYTYNLLRPITYIRDHIDPDWNTVIGTPPFPEYPSCHSTQSAAAAQVLTHYFGKKVSFTDNSKSDKNYAPRRFRNFYAFAQEAAISRFYGGVHYRFSCNLGYDSGLKIGDNIATFSFRK
jgi:hypothetical protein